MAVRLPTLARQREYGKGGHIGPPFSFRQSWGILAAYATLSHGANSGPLDSALGTAMCVA